MSVVEGLAAYLVQAGATTIIQLFTLFGPGLVLVALLSKLAGLVQLLSYRTLGRYLYLLLFGWLGTTIHDTGHALFALAFGHKIAKFQPFNPDAKTGRLGYVIHGYDRNSIYQQIGLFFIGIAPVLFGTTIIFVALLILFGADLAPLMQNITVLASGATFRPGLEGLAYATLAYCGAILAFLFTPAHLADWRFYLFLYLAFAIGSSMRLSKSDIAGATAGFIVLVILVLVFNLATLWQGGVAAGALEFLSQSYAFFYVILALTLALNVLAALLLLLPAALLSR